MTCPKCGRSCGDDFLYCPACGKKLKTAPKKKAPRRANGEGSVYKMSGKLAKPWRAMRMIDGVHYSVGCFRTEADARRAAVTFEPPSPSVVAQGMTLGDVYREVITRKDGKVSKSSVDTYNAAWRKLEPLADAPVTALHTADFQKIIDGMSGYSRSAVEKVRIVVSAIYDYCIANELCGLNPAKYLELPPAQKKEEKEVFTEDDIAALWDDGSEDAKIVLAMIYTGLRINELFDLTPDDVHVNEGGYTFIVGGEKTDAGRNRTVVLNRRISPVFSAWKERGGEYLITNSRGGKVDARNWRVRYYFPLLDRLGIERVNPHKARHTFATRIAAAGGNPVALQKAMGHADFSTTANIYTHPDMEALRQIAELVD